MSLRLQILALSLVAARRVSKAPTPLLRQELLVLSFLYQKHHKEVDGKSRIILGTVNGAGHQDGCTENGKNSSQNSVGI